MKYLFWISATIIAYAYFGYAAWLWLRCRWRRKPSSSAAHSPFVSVVLVIRDEFRTIEQKMRNLLDLDYPADHFEIVVVSDGSEDGTNSVLSRFAQDARVHVVCKPESQGKAAGINDGLDIAKGDVVLFTDVRQFIEPLALRLLVEDFADPTVGCSSGELMLGNPSVGETSARMGLYWKLEKKVRELESACGSTVGATGALYAARRELIVPVPRGTILDDVFIPMHIVRQGFRTVFNSGARAWDLPDLGLDREFKRKVRTLSGNYQLLQLAPWLLTRANPIRFSFVSHKLLRLMVPFALVTLLVTSLALPAPVYRIALHVQLLVYGLAAISITRVAPGVLARLADASFTFVVLNTAAFVAFVNFITGRKVVWGG